MPVKNVIEVARGELGYTENPPGSNRTKYGKAFGWDGVPWCVIFLWWCFREAGETTAFFAGEKTASCGTLFRWYKEQRLAVTMDKVKAGDLIFLNFHGGADQEHVGLVESVVSGPVLEVTTIEGNTTPGLGMEGSQDNGGCVARKIRFRSQIVGVARPKYKEVEMPKTDYEKHWAREDIDWCIEHGILTGYPDGTFQPDKPITRAELAVVCRRIIKYVKGG